MIAVAKRILATIASGAYLASPIDLIPDFIPVLGLADDTVVLLLALYYWHTLLRKKRQEDPFSGGAIIDVKPAEPDIP